jgi:signal peptidase I
MHKKLSIRWDRVFTTVSGEGQPVLFQIFLICSCCIFIGEYFEKKEKLKTVNLIVKLRVIKPATK